MGLQSGALRLRRRAPWRSSKVAPSPYRARFLAWPRFAGALRLSKSAGQHYGVNNVSANSLADPSVCLGRCVAQGFGCRVDLGMSDAADPRGMIGAPVRSQLLGFRIRATGRSPGADAESRSFRAERGKCCSRHRKMEWRCWRVAESSMCLFHPIAAPTAFAYSGGRPRALSTVSRVAVVLAKKTK